MNNRLALLLLLVLLAGLAADYRFNGFQGSLFMARKFVDLTDYIAIWR